MRPTLLGLKTKRSTTANGGERGGKLLSRGHIYGLLWRWSRSLLTEDVPSVRWCVEIRACRCSGGIADVVAAGAIVLGAVVAAGALAGKFVAGYALPLAVGDCAEDHRDGVIAPRWRMFAFAEFLVRRRKIVRPTGSRDHRSASPPAGSARLHPPLIGDGARWPQAGPARRSTSRHRSEHKVWHQRAR